MTQPLSRRRFVSTLAAGTASAMICRTGTLRAAAAASPNERVAIGIIGCGKMANDYHIPELLRQTDTQVVAVCDVDTTRRTHAQRRVTEYYQANNRASDCQAVNDFRELLERKDIDAVCIVTPDHWHAIPLIMACQAGKDVYCEKPLTLTLAESQQCIAAARKHQRVVQVGSQQRSNVFGPFREAVEFVRSGRLGKISRVTVGVGGPSVACDLPEEALEPGLDWNLWLGAAPERPYNSTLSPRGVHNHFPAWRNYREYSGGGHSDMGAHHYDIAQWALDFDATGPTEIIPPDDPSSHTGAICRYANGIEIVHGGPDGCTFHGENGTLRITRGHLSSDPAELTQQPLADDEIHLEHSPGHHRNWLDCVHSRKRPLADVEAGARTAAIIHLANAAYWNRHKLRWDPDQWKFLDAADNALLDRERRDPWQLPG